MVEWLKNFFDNYVVAYGLKILGALILIVVGFFLVNRFVMRIRTHKVLRRINDSARSFLASFISVGAKILLIFSAVVMAGVPSATVVALLGSCGLAIGLALQGGLSNFAGGVILMFLKPFRLGDYISAAGSEGTVTEIGIFYTVLLTVDGKRIVIPNGTLTNSTITNCTAEKNRRVILDYNVSSACDVDKVRDILMDVMVSSTKILFDPPCDVVIQELSDNCTTFRARAWCANEDYYDATYELNEAVRKAFTENRIDAPFKNLGIRAVQK